MAVACNLGKVDRALRVLIGAIMAVASLFLRAHFFGAIAVGIAGLVILVEGAIGH